MAILLIEKLIKSPERFVISKYVIIRKLAAKLYVYVELAIDKNTHIII